MEGQAELQAYNQREIKELKGQAELRAYNQREEIKELKGRVKELEGMVKALAQTVRLHDSELQKTLETLREQCS